MDFHLYQTVKWKEQLLEKIKDSPLYELDHIYKLSELDEWRYKIFEWLNHLDNEPKIENKYITINRVSHL